MIVEIVLIAYALSRLLGLTILMWLVTTTSTWSAQERAFVIDPLVSALVSKDMKVRPAPEQLVPMTVQVMGDVTISKTLDTVPPGMYAEYGYTRLELNDANTASVYFEKEWEKWPESRFLMEKVMERLTTTTTEPAVPGDV